MNEKEGEIKRLEAEVNKREREVDSIIRGQKEITKEKAAVIDVLRT